MWGKRDAPLFNFHWGPETEPYLDSGQHTPSLRRSLDRDKVDSLSLPLSIPLGILGVCFSFVGVGAKTSIDFSISLSETVILSGSIFGSSKG